MTHHLLLSICGEFFFVQTYFSTYFFLPKTSLSTIKKINTKIQSQPKTKNFLSSDLLSQLMKKPKQHLEKTPFIERNPWIVG